MKKVMMILVAGTMLTAGVVVKPTLAKAPALEPLWAALGGVIGHQSGRAQKEPL